MLHKILIYLEVNQLLKCQEYQKPIHDSQGLVLRYPPKHINVWNFELVTQSLRYCMTCVTNPYKHLYQESSFSFIILKQTESITQQIGAKPQEHKTLTYAMAKRTCKKSQVDATWTCIETYVG